MKAAQSKAPRKRVTRNVKAKAAAAKMVRPSRTPLHVVKKRAQVRYDNIRALHLRDGKDFTEIAKIETERLGLARPLTRERIRALMRKRCGVTPSESRNALHEVVLCRHCGLPFLVIKSHAEAGRMFINSGHYQAYHSRGVEVGEIPTIVQNEEERGGRKVWRLYVVYPGTDKTQTLAEYTAEIVLGRQLVEGEIVKNLDGDERNVSLSNFTVRVVGKKGRGTKLSTLAKQLKRHELLLKPRERKPRRAAFAHTL